jgi:hypothetical protein
LGDAVEQAAYKVDSGEAILSEAVAEVITNVLWRDPDWDPAGARAIAMARLVSQAWHVLASQLERQHGRVDDLLGFDEAIVGLDEGDFAELVELLRAAMEEQGTRAALGEVTIAEAVEIATEQLMPHLRRLSMKHQVGLPRVVRELTSPFRMSAWFQVAFADALDAASRSVMEERA